jgi:hypothetical protein
VKLVDLAGVGGGIPPERMAGLSADGVVVAESDGDGVGGVVIDEDDVES